jgi:CHAT domain-containing protein/Tfp pilus assembly protein PilF
VSRVGQRIARFALALLVLAAFGYQLKAVAQTEQPASVIRPVDAEAIKQLVARIQSLRQRGNNAEALPLMQQLVTSVERVLGPDHAALGPGLGMLAELYQATGRYEQALPLYLRALAISEKAQGPEHPNTGEMLNNLALLYQDMGRYDQALPMVQRALAIIEKAQGPEHPNTGKMLDNLAGLYQDMGRYDQALPLVQRALAISEKAQGPEHPDTGSNLSNLATLYEAMGRYDQALPLFQRALAISEKAQGPEHPSTGTLLNNLASLYRAMGRYEQALALVQRALAISEKTQGPEHPSTGTRLNNLASLYWAMGRYEQALPLFQRALAISEKAHGPEHPNTGKMLDNLAGLYQDMGRYEQALQLVQRALAISEKVQGPEHPSAGTRLNNLAVLYQAMGRYEQALQLYQRALAVASGSGSPVLSWTVQGNLMRLHSTVDAAARPLRSPLLAIWYGKQAVNTLQAVRGRMQGLDDELRSSFLARNKRTYARLANLLIDTGRIAEAEQVLAMLKEREIFELLRSSGAAPSSAQASFDGLERAALDQQRQLQAQAVAYSRELAALERQRRGAGNLPKADEARRQSLLEEAQIWRASYQRFLRELGEQFAGASHDRVGDARDADQQSTRLQARVALDPAGALGLHYVITEERIGIIVATPRGSFGRFSAVPRAELELQIAALRQTILARADTRAPAQALWRMLIEPVQADIRATGAQTLVLSLTDSLRYLPFAALQAPDGRYLVQDHALALWAAAADVTPSTGRTPWQVTGLGLSEARPGFSALPAVPKELAAIVRTSATDAGGVLPGTVALDEQFTRARFDEALTGGRNVLHVASHFDFKPGDEGRSVLLLGKGEPISLGQLAVMDFSEIDQLTLSACDTATGGGVNENGAEVEGLAAVVLRQRAGAVLATLWKVADESTAALMRDFYAQRAHDVEEPRISRAQALRRAQLAMLRGEGSVASPEGTERGGSRVGVEASSISPQQVDPAQRWAHPYFWAPFVISGNWL